MFKEDEFLLEEVDFEKLGFKAGLEIHRRMKGTKLFCRCPADLDKLEDAKEIKRIRRIMSISRSEIGEIDKATLEEIKKGRVYEYVFYDKGTCLIESDEEPPLPPLEKTIEMAIKTSLMLNCKIPPEIIFMRKIVVDGSNTTGFQRTGIVGYDGYLETSKGKVGIQTVCLEEESAQIVSQDNEKVVYDLRRLGIPLIEIATSPDLKDGDHVKEVAKKIGDILKATGFYQRGLGSIRQDVNISINDRCRVEIKGIQDLEIIPEVVKKEVIRQYALLSLRVRLKDIKLEISELEDLNKEFDGKKIFMFKIKGAKGLFKVKITPTRTLGNEIAGYVKIRTKAKGFIHSDEDIKKYKIYEIIKDVIKDDDLYVFVIGDKELAEQVRDEISRFFQELIEKGLQDETRKVLDNGDTTFMRPLPGAARMYPETDVPPYILNDEKINLWKSNLPRTLEYITQALMEEGLNRELITQFIESKYFDLFLEDREFFEDKAKEKISVLLNMVKDIERKEGINVMESPRKVKSAITLFLNGMISKEAFLYVLSKAYKEDESPEGIIEREGLYKISKDEIRKEIDSLDDLRPGNVISYFKRKYGLRVDIKDVMEVLRDKNDK